MIRLTALAGFLLCNKPEGAVEDTAFRVCLERCVLLKSAPRFSVICERHQRFTSFFSYKIYLYEKPGQLTTSQQALFRIKPIKKPI